MKQLLIDLVTLTIGISITVLLDRLLHFDTNITWASINVTLVSLYLTKDAWSN